jgi:sulfate adenylyltransferase subunit 1
VLKDEIDISRGDLLVDAQVTLPAVQSASVDVVDGRAGVSAGPEL